MDFYWTPYFNSFWIFPILCFLFMVVVMLACGSMLFRRHGHQYRDTGDNAAGSQRLSEASDARRSGDTTAT
jgi:uncharacterized membrane protein